jgi:hypothetical protein
MEGSDNTKIDRFGDDALVAIIRKVISEELSYYDKKREVQRIRSINPEIESKARLLIKQTPINHQEVYYIKNLLQTKLNIRLQNDEVVLLIEKYIKSLRRLNEETLNPFYPILWINAIDCSIQTKNSTFDKIIFSVIQDVTGLRRVISIGLFEDLTVASFIGHANELYSRNIRNIGVLIIDQNEWMGQNVNLPFKVEFKTFNFYKELLETTREISAQERKQFIKELRNMANSQSFNDVQEKMNGIEIKWKIDFPNLVNTWKSRINLLETMWSLPFGIRKSILEHRISYNLNIKFLNELAKSPEVKDTRALPLLFIDYLESANWQRRKVLGWSNISKELVVFRR